MKNSEVAFNAYKQQGEERQSVAQPGKQVVNKEERTRVVANGKLVYQVNNVGSLCQQNDAQICGDETQYRCVVYRS